MPPRPQNALIINRLKELFTLDSLSQLLFDTPPAYPPDFSKTLPTGEAAGRMATRRASHAGSWYVSDPHSLGRELDDWLARASASHGVGAMHARAIIGPHAGYRYCGACGGHAYARIRPEHVKRVFILGPSHHVRLSGCALSACAKYATPFYDLTLDRAMNAELMATEEFEVMSLEADEDEHSIEMHLPYIARVMQRVHEAGSPFTIVPVLVGSLTPEKEAKYGRIFAKYLADPTNLFIVSSDFCHWGQRFRYTEYDESKGQIHQFIKHLDYEGMEIIESMDHGAFSAYLKRTGNTICGRHPIGVFLGAVNALKANKAMINGFRMDMQFLNYDQSNACKSMRDSSVSYAAAVYTLG